MKLEKLLLTKEELPILYECCFQIPIHPRLLDNSISIDSDIGHKIFRQVALEWHEDLKSYAESLEDAQKKNWIKDVFLRKNPEISREYGRQVLNIVSWEDQVLNAQNGFARSFSISRNVGGSIYFNHDELSSYIFVALKKGSEFIKFPEEKLREFAREVVDIDGTEGAVIDIYNQHNVDYYPGALFLRNWAIAYMNETFKKHYKELFQKA